MMNDSGGSLFVCLRAITCLFTIISIFTGRYSEEKEKRCAVMMKMCAQIDNVRKNENVCVCVFK